MSDCKHKNVVMATCGACMFDKIQELEEKLNFLKSKAYYKSPSYGYHNGGWDIHIRIKGEESCPRDLDEAISRAMKEKSE